jgi:hypothetical protein
MSDDDPAVARTEEMLPVTGNHTAGHRQEKEARLAGGDALQ